MEKTINIDDFITQTLKLAEINRGFEVMRVGETICCVVVFYGKVIISI